MAIVWGPWSKRIRFGFDITQTPSSVLSGTASVDLTVKLYFEATYAYAATKTVSVVSAGGTDSFSYAFSSSNGTTTQKLIRSYVISAVPTSYAATVARTFSASVNSDFFDDARPTTSLTWTVAKRPPQAPSAPSSASAVLAGSTATVSWVRPGDYASDATKWASAQIQRIDGTGAWVTRATVAASATSWANTGLAANQRYAYRVSGVNVSGTTVGTQTGFVYSTPPTPTGVSAAKSGSDIVVSFTSTATWASSYDLYDLATGTVVASGVSSPITHATPNPAVTHQYRVRAVVPGGLTGAYSANSNLIELQAPPLAPTNLAPNGAGASSALAVTLSWKHAPVDGSVQTEREVRYRVVGAGSWTTSTATTAVQSLNVGVLDAGSYEWQVRTRGADPAFGPWSALGKFSVADQPAATLTSPDATVAGKSTTIAWTYAQSAGQLQSAFEAQILEGATVYATSGIVSSAGRSWKSPQSLEDAGSYTARVRVRSSAGVWSDWATQAFTVAFAPPAVPTLTAEWVPGAGMVEVHATAQAGAVPTETLTLERSINGEDWVLVGTDPDDVSSTDIEVPLSGSLRYRATATSATPSTAEQIIYVTSPHDSDDHSSCGVWLNAGAGYTAAVLFPSNVDITEGVGLERALTRYDGRALPVPLDSMHVGRSFSVRVEVLVEPDHPSPFVATRDNVREVAMTKGVAMYRDPDGTLIYCQLSDVTMTRGPSKLTPSQMGFTVTEVSRPTEDQLAAMGGYHVSRLVQIRPGEFVLAGGPSLTQAQPGEYVEVDA